MYKLRKGFTLPKEFKVKVNPEQSEALQKHLFKKLNRNLEVSKTEYEYVCIYGAISAMSFSNSYWNFFNNISIKEIDFDTYFEKVKDMNWNSIKTTLNTLNGEWKVEKVEESQNSDNCVFPLEIKRLQKENEQLRHKILMLTSKIELANMALE
jgi:hypothetical protein